MIRRALTAAAVTAMVMIPQSISAQYIGLTQWTSGPGANFHFYAMTELAGDYRDVSAVAESVGGTLVSITSAEENEFVYNSMSAFGTCSPVWCLPSTFYIGLERVSPDGPFAWQTGEEVSFTSWNTNEPNNGAGNEQVAHMFYGNAGSPASGAAAGEGELLWNDIPYNRYPMRGVIEWSVPEPGTYLLLLTGFFGLGFAAWRRKQELLA